LKPQRFGVVDGGLGPDQKTFFTRDLQVIVLFDGISPEPVFDAGIVIIQSPVWSGWRRSFVKLEKKVHPIIDSLPDKYAINFLCYLVEGIRIWNSSKSVVFHLV